MMPDKSIWVPVFATVLVVSSAGNLVHGDDLTDSLVRKLAEKLVRDDQVRGMSVGYIQGNRWGIEHLGVASSGGAKPDNLTLYEIGSLSKVFTSILLADAVSRGIVDLDDPVRVANAARIELPSFRNEQITWLDLSTHRSGLPRLPSNLQLTSITNPYKDYNSRKAAAFLREHELSRSPGARQEYSNFAVSVLGYLLAAKQDADYQTLLRTRIAQPLRMDDCTIALDRSQRKRLATPFRIGMSAVPAWDFSDLPGAGGIRATMRDLMRFAKAQMDPPPGELGEAINLAWKQHTSSDDSGPAMGLGWMIRPDGTRWHNGETGGSHSMLAVNREQKTAVIVLSNTAPGSKLDELAFELMRHATDEDAEEGEIDPQRLEGRYQLTPTFIFDVKLVEDKLMVGITNQPTQRVFPESPTKWSYRGVQATLEFHLTDRGPAHALTLHQNGARQRAKRIRD